MKSVMLLIAVALSLLALSACVAMTQTATNSPASPALSETDPAESGNSPLPTASVTATVQPTISPTVVLTASPTVSATVTVSPTAPVAPTDTPTPGGTESPAPTDTPMPEPTDTPTPEPPTATPTVTPTEGPSPTPTPLPQAVFVRDHQMVRQGSDMLVVGEVTNGSGQPVYNVTVSAAFYDQGGNLIAAQEATAYLPQTLQTQNNPFKIVLANAPASVSTYELVLRWDDLTALGFDRITVVSEEVETDPTVAVHGELRNDGLASMSNVAVAVTFYDADGNVVDAYPGRAASAPIDPGVTTTYRVDTGRGDIPFERFMVQAQGVVGR
jgi:hypothetical protein